MYSEWRATKNVSLCRIVCTLTAGVTTVYQRTAHNVQHSPQAAIKKSSDHPHCRDLIYMEIVDDIRADNYAFLG